MTHVIELDWIRLLQTLRGPLLDTFFKLLNFFDRQEFLFLLLPCIWLSKGWRTGLKLFSILFISSITNQALKELFASPRPFHLDASLAVIQVKGFSFPSGAAQTVILLSGMLIHHLKSSLKWTIAFIYIFFVSLSRVYLGLHFVTDILAGWLIGGALLLIYLKVFPKLEAKLSQFKMEARLGLGCLIPFLSLSLLHSNPIVAHICYACFGIMLGLWINYAYSITLHPAQSLSPSLLRSSIGITGLFLLYGATELIPLEHIELFQVLRFGTLGFWLSCGSGLACLELIKNSHLKH